MSRVYLGGGRICEGYRFCVGTGSGRGKEERGEQRRGEQWSGGGGGGRPGQGGAGERTG